MKVLLIDVDSKIPNLALMKLSSWHKEQGDTVYLNTCDKPDRVYASTVFTRSKTICEHLQKAYPGIEIGGTGWDIEKKLPQEIDQMQPDYTLYSYPDILDFSTRGCVRNCEFCFVPKKEGRLCQYKQISQMANKGSKNLTLLDNNFTADPQLIDKCQEIKERDLTVDICQGVDIRLITTAKAKALSQIKHKKQVHFAWDLMKFEKQVMEGIKITTEYIKPYRLMCYVLCGFNTTFEEDYYRVMKLREMKIDPYVMVYNEITDTRLKHFERWVNAKPIFKSTKWTEYEPWIKAQQIDGQIAI